MLLVPGWYKGIQAFVCMSLIASICTLLLAILYTFVHYVSKRLVQLLFILAAALAGNIVYICLFVCVFMYKFLPVYVSTCRNIHVIDVYIYYLI